MIKCQVNVYEVITKCFFTNETLASSQKSLQHCATLCEMVKPSVQDLDTCGPSFAHRERITKCGENLNARGEIINSTWTNLHTG